MSTRAKALIITEKPSVARDIVQALGGFRSMEGGAYWERDDYLCTFAIGHIFTFLEPEDLDPALRSWRLETLPILPKKFALKPVTGQEKRIEVIRRLLARPDVTNLVNACDAAREGELIFREIVRYFDDKKWVRRLWLQSMTTEAIQRGFQSLREGTDLDGLAAAAECRAESDWLIGMNATRAFSTQLRSGREAKPWSVGRVQTPTLALLVQRELTILSHVPAPFFRVKARFAAPDHEYDGTWFDPHFKKTEKVPATGVRSTRPASEDEAGAEARDDRIFEEEAARGVIKAISGKTGRAEESREESPRHAPWLFNLTGLQKFMAQRYKWSSKRTLESAQRCYEQHKVLTYPRTSSSCLPSDYRGEVDRLVAELAQIEPYSPHARNLQENGRRNERRVFDDKGVSDHFAIIPTGKLAGKQKNLSGDDEKLFDAVVRRFLATFHPPAIYDRVKRVTVVEGHSFRTGPVETLMEAGWLAVYGKSGRSDEDESEVGVAGKVAPSEEKLAPLVPGQRAAKDVPARALSAKSEEQLTRPLPRITEAQLLGLMENAGRYVESEELASALLSAEGLGTAATRADIIQNLKAKEYVDDALRPTAKGIQLVTVLKRLGVARLTSAELTARLELELGEVEGGTRPKEKFMGEVAGYATEVVAAARALDLTRLYCDEQALGLCPVCRTNQVFERAANYACDGHGGGCPFVIWKEISGRYIDRVSATEFVEKLTTRELDGFQSRQKKMFKGRLVWRVAQANELARVVVEPLFPAVDQPTEGSASDKRPGHSTSGAASDGGPGAARSKIAECPVHGAGCGIVETRGAFVCETRLKEFSAGAKEPRGFMLPKLLCRRSMSEADAKALVAAGETRELSGFISKTGRSFAAKLKATADGGFTFAFQERRGASTGKSDRAPPRAAPSPASTVTRRRPRKPDTGIDG